MIATELLIKILRGYAGIYLLQVNNGNTRKMCEIGSHLNVKIVSEQR